MNISVVIPVYNAEKYISKCLDSVCAQADCVKEIILVDDGSSDGGPDICKIYAERDKRIKIVARPNTGTEQAIIDGVNAASGDYIGFVDSDDYIEPDMFSVLAERAERDDADVCVCNYSVVDDDGKILHEYDLGFADGVYRKTDGRFDIQILPTIADGRFISAFRWNKIFRRELLINNIAFIKHDIKMGEDFAMVLPVVMSADTIVCVNKRLYNYVERSGSLSHSDYTGMLDDSLKLIYVLEEAANRYGYSYENIDENLLAVLMNHYVRKIARSGMSFSDKRRAYKELRRDEKVTKLFSSVKIKTSFKRALLFRLLKHKQYGLLAMVY